MLQAMIDIKSEHNVSKNNKNKLFQLFELISPGCDLEMISPRPWGSSPMEPNTMTIGLYLINNNSPFSA